jgi:hypothetical protein
MMPVKLKRYVSGSRSALYADDVAFFKKADLTLLCSGSSRELLLPSAWISFRNALAEMYWRHADQVTNSGLKTPTKLHPVCVKKYSRDVSFRAGIFR